MSSTIKQAMAGAVEYLTAHPDEARYRDGAARASLRDGLVVEVIGDNGERLTTDMVPSVGGTGTAPSSGWILRAAAASCVTTLVTMRAASLDIPVDSLTVSVDSESDDRGILGMDADIPAGPLRVRIAVAARSAAADQAGLRAVIDWAVAHCPVTDALQRPVPLDIVIEDE
jgi:uncharacterized OsmC-like protein